MSQPTAEKPTAGSDPPMGAEALAAAELKPEPALEPAHGSNAMAAEKVAAGQPIAATNVEPPAEPLTAREPAAEPAPSSALSSAPDAAAEARTGHSSEPHGRYLIALGLGALGVVYGDIGTSPLYALRECFHGVHGVAVTRDNVLGVLSLMFWSLTMTISIKYTLYILRADNKGEGGTLALTALASSALRTARGRALVALLGVFGASLVYGDATITPAISVLSAIEGLGVATRQLEHFVVPITILILIGLFTIQRHGTARVGALFGPVMVLWFGTLAVLGVINVLHHPSVLAAILPTHAAGFFIEHGWTGVTVLGAVVLVVTGGEALYADLGHFGRKPIRLAWYSVAMPALLM
ncbi:MAG TPA: KUP/HAK/KT family potassium transporter, partial [Polyangiaceae bacterium]|nr:KUP/HAK/KT family potassium transporter [Polyangiaceae bacterium]